MTDAIARGAQAAGSSTPANSSLERRVKSRLISAYERFEQLVVLALSLVIALVIVMTLVQLYQRVLPLIVGGVLDPLDHATFQALFGSIFTVLIAMEFKHSIIRAALRRDSIVQVRTVLLIALLAMSRKFVIVDIESTPAATIGALGAVALVLGIVYWLLGDRISSRDDPSATD